MKLLTLNTHAWLESAAEEKFEQLVQHLIDEDYDWIALQEVNQTIGGDIVPNPSRFLKTDQQQPILKDNYAWMLIQALEAHDLNYYWAWAYNHIGYDRYEEGVALLAKQPFNPQRVLLSESDDPTDYHTRAALVANTEHLIVGSCHFSWWQSDGSGFKYEWEQLQLNDKLSDKGIILMGDFNAPAHIRQQSYDLATRSLNDAYLQAKEVSGNATVPSGIDGWKDTTCEQRIDLVLLSNEFDVRRYQSVLDGSHGPIVSDHYGVQVDCSYTSTH